MARNERKTLTVEERFAIADLYSQGIGTIHQYAAMYDVAIGTIRKALDEYDVPHAKGTGNTNMPTNNPVTVIYHSMPSVRNERRAGQCPWGER